MAVKASAQITMTDVTDIDSTCRYYLLQSSTLSKPSKPTTNPPSSSWTKTEPSYTAGSTNSLYFTDLTVYSNGEFSYSDVSLSSSYEAAKAAYNKAVAAQNAANTAQSTANNAQSSATAAAKTATNYIDYSSTNGLQVGNKTSGSWSGFRTQITSSAFNILNAAGETLASYGAKLVELGKNASDAVVSFCNDVARIYVEGGGRAVLESWGLLLSATNTNSQAQVDLTNSDGVANAKIKSVAFKTASQFFTALIEVIAKTDGTSKIAMTANDIEMHGDVTIDKAEVTEELTAGIIKVGNGNAISVIGTGTWTPEMSGLDIINLSVGNYVKIGDVVIINFFVTGVFGENATVDNSGFLCITGIPFEAAAGQNWYAGGGHWQGGHAVDTSAYFSGYALAPDTQRIYPRTSKVPQDMYLEMGGGYICPTKGKTLYCSGTIMYKTVS